MAEAIGTDIFFDNVNGLKLFSKCWNSADVIGDNVKVTTQPQAQLQTETQSQTQIQAVVFICHGFAEHCQRYDEIAQKFVAQKWFVFSHDHVGHGRSEGTRADIDNFEDYVTDVVMHIESVNKKHAGVPIFIVGHSMGGLLAVKAALRLPELIRGVVCIGPAFDVSPLIFTPWKVRAVSLLCKVLPQFPVAPCLNAHELARDPKIADSYMQDPLVYHGGVKARFVNRLFVAMKEFQNHMSEVACPLFILHGDKDAVCELGGAQMMHEKASSTDKTLKVMPGAYHQLHSEPDGEGERVIQDIIDWITARI